jgi:uncharacterized membrane protein
MQQSVAAAAPIRLPRLGPGARKSVLILHVISSVGWLGLNIGTLTLTITGLTTSDADRQHAAFQALGILGDLLLIPISLTAFVTGLLLALGTRWGLFRHWWVVVKFGLTLIAVVLIPLSLLPGIHDVVATVSATEPGTLADIGGAAPDLLAAGFVSTTMYTVNVVLSVLKPRRRTQQRGRADRERVSSEGRT